MRQMCLNTVYDLARKNKNVIFIGSDLGPGVLNSFKEKYPESLGVHGF